MTYGKLKEKILVSLGLGTDGAAYSDDIAADVETAMPEAINSAARNVSAILGCVKKRETITFNASGEYKVAACPQELCSLVSVYSGGKRYAPQCFDIIGSDILTVVDVTAAEIVYTAYPESVDDAEDTDELEYGDVYADAVALGAAMTLCPVAYPGDYNRYLTLATEYDALMANTAISSYGGRAYNVQNSLFGGRRII